MRKHLVIAALAIVSAFALPHQTRAHTISCDLRGCRPDVAPASPRAGHARSLSKARRHRHSLRHKKTHQRSFLADLADPRPREWCAWFLRRKLGIPRSAFRPGEWNLARAFRYLGDAAARPGAGVIVVWPHHVGIIVGGCDRRGCVVLSGNDGHRVRERYRTFRGVIAYRRWDSVAASL